MKQAAQKEFQAGKIINAPQRGQKHAETGSDGTFQGPAVVFES